MSIIECFCWVLASEQRCLAEILLTPKFWSQKSPNFACRSQISQISFQKMLRSLGLGLGLETFLVSEKFGLGKKSRFRKIWYRKKSLDIGFAQNFGIVIQCSQCLHILQSLSQRFFPDYDLMSYFVKIFPDLSNRKKSIKTTQMTGLYKDRDMFCKSCRLKRYLSQTIN